MSVQMQVMSTSVSLGMGVGGRRDPLETPKDAQAEEEIVLSVHVMAQAGMLGRVVLVCARIATGKTARRRARGLNMISEVCGE